MSGVVSKTKMVGRTDVRGSAVMPDTSLPEGWKWLALRSVCLETNMVDPSREPERAFRYVDVSAVSNEGWQIQSFAECTGATAPSRARKLVKADDVIFATIRPTLRRVAMVPASLDAEVVSTAFCVLRADPAKADPKFVYYSVLADDFIDRVGGLQHGASYPAVSDGEVFQQRIAIPPLAEQQAIAAMLGKLQQTLKTQNTIVAALKELKAATMVKLFREGLRSEPLKQTEIGEIPESWEVTPLGQSIVLAQYGLSIRGERSGRSPMLRMNCQDDGRVIFRDLQFVDLDAKIFETFRLSDGDLLFNRTNSFELVGRTSIFHGDREAVFASYLIRLRVDRQSMDPDYLNYYLQLKSVQNALKGLATRGVSQSNISASKLRLFPVGVPSLKEQRQIAETLDRLSLAVSEAMRKDFLLRQTFVSLLQQLMSGQIRVRRGAFGVE